MNWMESIMAFAVTMMALSTLVSMGVEMIHRTFRLREKKLYMILEQIHGRLSLINLPPEARRSQTEFAKKMTQSHLNTPQSPRGPTLLNGILNAGRTQKISAADFIERLARTREGRALLECHHEGGTNNLGILMEDLLRHYQRCKESAREYFTRRARLFSVLLALALAFLLNIHPGDIFTTYLKEARLRTGVIQALDPNGKEQSLQIPLGWQTPRMEKMKMDWSRDPSPGNRIYMALSWLLSTTLGGLLIGLGGPFWFALFKRISTLAAVPAPSQGAMINGKSPPKGVDTLGVSDLFTAVATASHKGD